MKGWVFGIVGVFCLQAGFIALTGIDRPFETMVAVNEVTSYANPVADMIGFTDADEFVDYESEPSTVEVLGESIAVPTRAKRTISRRSRNERPVGKGFVTQPEPKSVNFEPVILAIRKHQPIKLRTEYPRLDPVALAPDARQQPVQARAVFKPKNKSMASKSISVLKKPYDWLKALGSKFK